MMRRLVTVALMAAVGFVGFAPASNAGVEIDLLWRDTGTSSLTVSPGDAGATCNVGFNNPAAPGRCLDVVLKLTNETLTVIGVSVQYDGSSGLAFSQGFAWFGVTWPVGKASGSMIPAASRTAYISGPGVVSDFTGFTPPPAGPPSLPPGTYHLGTIVWNTSGASSTVLNAFISPGLDDFINGSFNSIIGGSTLNSALLNVTVIPEPGTASLLGLGLVGLIVAGRRRNRK